MLWRNRPGRRGVVDSEEVGEQAASDAALARAARLGDREAFEVIVHRHGPAMYRYARRMLTDHGATEEVVQDAFVAAWRGMDTYRGESTLRTWLFSLTAHKAIDHRRKARARPIDDQLLLVLPADDHAGPLAELTQAELLAALEAALAELPQRQRACWILREIEGLTHAEIGQVLNLSDGAIRGQLHRGRRSVAQRMARWR